MQALSQTVSGNLHRLQIFYRHHNSGSLIGVRMKFIQTYENQTNVLNSYGFSSYGGVCQP